MKFKETHPLHLPETVLEWWNVKVSWDNQSKHHLFSTVESARAYAQKRVDGLVKARANSKVYLPLVTEWQENLDFCVCRCFLGVVLLHTPVWDYEVRVEYNKRG